MISRLWLAATAIPLSAWACGGSHDSEASLDHYGQEVTQSLDALETTTAAHHQQVFEASDLSQVTGLEQAYAKDMGAQMSEMSDAHDSIGRCSDEHTAAHGRDGWESMHDANASMGTAMNDTSGELERHHRAMRAAPDLASAMAEEHAHQAAMDGAFKDMRSRDDDMAKVMDAMDSRGMSMMCSMGSHMHM